MTYEKQSWSARRPAAIGFAAIAILIGGLGVWALETEIAGAVISHGFVKVENDRQVVQHPEGGVVHSILVREGDQVGAGDVLVRFDDTFLRSEIEIIDRQLLEIYARQVRLEAERDGIERIEFSIPSGFDGLDPFWVENQIEGQASLFAARAASIVSKTQILKEQQTQIERQIEGLSAQFSAAQTEEELVQEELARKTTLLEKGLLQASDVNFLRRDQAQIRGQLGRLAASIGEARVRISALEIEKLGLADQHREQAIVDLRDLRFSEIELAERRLAALERLSRMDVRAPVGGTIFGSVVLAERSVVRPAEPMMYIVPNSSRFQVSARIDPLHIDQIHLGQPAVLRFTTFDQRTTPVFDGQVVRISADALHEQQTGMSFYEAIVEVNDLDDPSKTQLDIIPGMPVEVFLETTKRTPLSYLLKPFTDYFNRALREG